MWSLCVQFVTSDVFPNHLELVMSSALFPVRCIWAPVTRSHLDFPLLTTPSSHPPNPPACQSFLLSQSAPTLLPNCWGRSRPFPHSCLYAVCDSEMYLCVCVCVSVSCPAPTARGVGRAGCRTFSVFWGRASRGRLSAGWRWPSITPWSRCCSTTSLPP